MSEAYQLDVEVGDKLRILNTYRSDDLIAGEILTVVAIEVNQYSSNKQFRLRKEDGRTVEDWVLYSDWFEKVHTPIVLTAEELSSACVLPSGDDLARYFNL